MCCSKIVGLTWMSILDDLRKGRWALLQTGGGLQTDWKRLRGTYNTNLEGGGILYVNWSDTTQTSKLGSSWTRGRRGYCQEVEEGWAEMGGWGCSSSMPTSSRLESQPTLKKKMTLQNSLVDAKKFRCILRWLCDAQLGGWDCMLTKQPTHCATAMTALQNSLFVEKLGISF